MKEIKTLAELDALPVGSVLIDLDGDAWQKREVQLSDETAAALWYCAAPEVEDGTSGLLDCAPLFLAWDAKGESR